jgi:hypothetical protein
MTTAKFSIEKKICGGAAAAAAAALKTILIDRPFDERGTDSVSKESLCTNAINRMTKDCK